MNYLSYLLKRTDSGVGNGSLYWDDMIQKGAAEEWFEAIKTEDTSILDVEKE